MSDRSTVAQTADALPSSTTLNGSEQLMPISSIFTGAASGTIMGASMLLDGYCNRKQARTENERNREEYRSLQTRQFDFDREMAEFNRQTGISIEEIKAINQNFAWRTTPQTILKEYRLLAERKRNFPLFVAISPPTIDYDPHARTAREFPAIENELALYIRRFRQQLEQSGRPIIYRTGLWDSKLYHGEAAAYNLFSVLGRLPVLLLETELSDTSLNLRASTWGLTLDGTDSEPQNHYILEKFCYRDALDEFARQDAAAWEIQRQQYQAKGRTEEDIGLAGKLDEQNLRILEAERRDLADGIKRPRQYHITSKHYDSLAEVLAYCHNLTIGLVSDTYTQMSVRGEPLGLRLLMDDHFRPSCLGPPAATNRNLVSVYARTFRSMGGPFVRQVPDLFLDLADLSAQNDAPDLCVSLISDACDVWLEANQFGPTDGVESTINLAIARLAYEFVRRVRSAYEAAGDGDMARNITTLLAKERPTIESF